jgi:glycosyltransferase involved in cell wall biosynthesis
MGTRPPITAIVITRNEEANILRCLGSLAWAEERLVVDSGSTDRTRELAAGTGARVLEHAWEGYGQQKNWAMARAAHDWIVFLDADEEMSPGLRAEIELFVSTGGLVGGRQYGGANFPRRTWYLGRWIMHGGWYPNRLTRVCFRPKARWTEPAVHESLETDGPVYEMHGDCLHYTFRNVGEVLRAKGKKGSLFRILTKPVFKFLETYVWKLGFLDGFAGFVISVNAAHSIFMKYVELRLEKNPADRQHL